MNSILTYQTTLLENKFILSSCGPCIATLQNNVIILQIEEYAGKRRKEFISVSDIVGCQIIKNSNRILRSFQNFTTLENIYISLAIYSYPLKMRDIFISRHERRERIERILQICIYETREENLKLARKWQRAIQWLIKGLKFQNKSDIPASLPHAPKFLIFVNPRSGSGKAYRIFRTGVLPILTEHGAHFHLVITDRHNCARDTVKSADLRHWTAIVVVSGDGLLNEVVNGLMERPDWESAIQIPLGIVPGGSGNGLARTLSYTAGEPYEGNQVVSAAINLVRGRTNPLDLVRVETSGGSTHYSFLSTGWGLMADVDIESERLRALGEARFTLWALFRMLGLKKYRGRVSYLPVEGYEYNSAVSCGDLWRVSRSQTVDVTWGSVETVSVPFSQGLPRSKSVGAHMGKLTDPELYLQPNTTGIVKMDFSQEVPTNTCQGNLLSPLDQPVPRDWVVRDGEYVLVYAAYQTHLGTDVFFAPYAKLNDGIIWLVLIHATVTRAQMFAIFNGLQSGTYIKNEAVEMIPVRAFRLEPLSDGYMTIDGEAIPTQTIQAEILPGAANILLRT